MMRRWGHFEIKHGYFVLSMATYFLPICSATNAAYSLALLVCGKYQVRGAERGVHVCVPGLAGTWMFLEAGTDILGHMHNILRSTGGQRVVNG